MQNNIIYSFGVKVDQEKKMALIGIFDVEKAIKTVEKCPAGVPLIAVDTEHGFTTFGLAKQISFENGGRYLPLEESNGAPIALAVIDKLFHDPGIIIKND